MIKQLIAVAAVAAAAVPAQAVTVVQWNFNSVSADNNVGTGSTLASTGAGTASLLGTTATFATGSPNDLAADDSAWNLTSFPSATVGNKTEGAQFAVSTVGFADVVVTFDLRHSGTSSRYEQFQYTLDGVNYVDFALFSNTVTDSWNTRSVDLSAIAGADNNANFAFRVVSAFAPGTSAYQATGTGSYATTGTWRFDGVTVTAVTAVPEPGTYAMLLAGLASLGFIARRRRGA
jgi:hypothetical protein